MAPLSSDASLSSASIIASHPNKSHKYRIASIPGDGIGPEVVEAAIEVVNALAKTLKTFTIEWDHIPWGTAYYKKTGQYVDDDVLSRLRGYDASLFGAVGAPGTFFFPSLFAPERPFEGFQKKMLSNADVHHRRT